MMRTFLFLIILMIAGHSYGQGASVELRASVSDDDSGKSLAGATIEVYKAGSLFASQTSSSNGKVAPINLPVCVGCTYTIKIKKGGYVTKTAILDAHSDYPEEVPPGAQVQKFDVSIFESVEGIDFSFLDREPMIEFTVDAYGIVTYDQKKINVMQEKIKQLRKQMEEKKEELAKEEAAKVKLEADFLEYVKAGDAAVGQKDFEKAIGQYELALGLKADHQATKDKLADAKIKLEELRANEALEKQFGEKMAQAKTAYTNQELDKALSLYKEASNLKPGEALPKDRIKEIEAELAKQKENEAAFNKLVSDGDAAVSTKKFDDGISKYEAALKLKEDAGVKTKLEDAKKQKAAAENALAEEKAKQKEFDDLMAKANAEFDTEKFDDARKNYEAALKVKPEEALPKTKIAEIEKILSDRKAAEDAAAKKEADFQRLLAEGKEKINQRAWPEALAKYEEALKFKPNANEALDQIDFIKKEQAKDAEAAKLDEKYTALMAEAKTLFDAKKYKEARSKYNEASGVKSNEQAPKDQIIVIDNLLADAEKAAEAEANYKKFMSEGDAAQDRKEYTAAIDRYNKALVVKPGDADAQAKLDAVNKILEADKKAAEEKVKFDGFVATAEKAFNAKNYDEAKLNYNKALQIKEDQILKDKIAEIDALIAKNQSEAETKAKYDAAIKEADKLYAASNYQAALDKYTQALSIKEEDHPKARISELNKKIADMNAAQEKEKLFTDLVAAGDAAAAAKDYNLALDKYKEAINAKPDAGVSKKMGDIRVLLEAENQNAEKRAKYDEKIALADAELKLKKYKVARALYKEAGTIMASESYPDEQIKKIDGILADAESAELEAKYQKIIDEADNLFNAKKLDEAKSVYDRALVVKSGDAYATGQIQKIKDIKNERANDLAAKEKLEAEYAALIKDGERAMDAKNWQLALAKFNESLTKKPEESYPKNKIAEIKKNLGDAELKAQKDAEYLALITAGDKQFNSQEYMDAINSYNKALLVKDEQYPKDKIKSAENFMKLETENEEEAAYQKMLTVAQEKFDAKNYEKALELYLRAQRTKPTDPLPQQRIDEINQAMNRANSDKDKEEQYTDFLKEADYRFEKGEWSAAKDAYTSAYNLFNRKYPEDQIKKCEGSMRNATDETVEKNYRKIIDIADKNFGEKNYTKAKELYERAIGLKPGDQYPKDQLIEIDKILNPGNYTSAEPILKDYGKPNRSVSVLDVDKMLADAEEQRKYLSAARVEDQQVEALETEREEDVAQEDENQETRESVVELTENIDEDATTADDEREDAAWKVDEMQVDLIDEDLERTEMNDNDVQLQNQVVNNLNREIDERDEASDLGREEYLLDVDAIRSELILETELEDADQTNATRDQRDYVVDEVENREDDDRNNDLARKNTEVKVEDFDVQLINEANENAWDQEDVVMSVKEESETLVDIQTKSDFDENLKRIEAADEVIDETQDRINIEGGQVDNQYDVNIESKKYTENVVDEIDIASVANDIPRQDMEDFVEEQQLENEDVLDELIVDQENDLHTTDNFVEDLEYDLIDEERAAEDKREGYELIVDELKEDNNVYLEGEESDIENKSHSTVDYIESEMGDRNNLEVKADDSADETIDATSDSIDEMREKNNELDDDNRAEQEAVEEYVEDLREIDINKVDEQMKNSLGEKFPEGVTEEIYTINDEDGLMESYIVRRIVVENGAGNVYEKTQSKFGTATYTCNGHGITEYQWQDETEAAHLVRN